MSESSQLERFSGRVVVMCPEDFPVLIDRAARKRIMNRSDYVRQAVIDRLRADGVLAPAQAMQNYSRGE